MKFRLHVRTTPTEEAIRFTPASLVVTTRPMRVLDFDVEARPLHWISGDYVSKEITAMAWAWIDDQEHVECRLLGECDPVVMLTDFVAAWNQADMVTGHYIRGYDIGMVQGALT